MVRTKQHNVEKNSKKQASLTRTELIWLGAILLFTFLIYSGTIDYELLSGWDDGIYLQDEHVHELSVENISHYFSTYYLGVYQPIPVLSFAINYSAAETSATAYHGTNLILHLINTLLVFLFVRKLRKELAVPLIAAFLFAIHPMHVESVTWISTRGNLLYSTFFILSMIFYLNYLVSKKINLLIWTLVWFIFSLFSKSMAMSLPFVLLLFDYLKGRKIDLRVIVEKIPFLILSIIFGLVAISAAESYGHISHLDENFSLFDRLFLLSYGIVFYLVRMIFPFNMSAIYAYPEKIDGALPWEYYLAFYVVIAIVFLIYRMKLFQKETIFASLFYLVTIGPVLPLVWSRMFIAGDRYTYIPYTGFFFLAGLLFTHLNLSKKSSTRRFAPYFAGLLILLAVIFTYQTVNRNKAWKNSLTLMNDAVEKAGSDKELAIASFFRGNVHDQQGMYNEAIRDFSRAISLKPDYWLAYNNRGIVKGILGQNESAITDFDKAIRIKEDYSEAYYNRGIAWYQLNQMEKACHDWSRATDLGFDQARKIRDQYCQP